MFAITKASSNFFKVKDRAKFEEWAEEVYVDVIDLDDGSVAIGSDGGWPYVEKGNEVQETSEETRLALQLSKHLTDDSVAVLTTFFMDHEAGSAWGIAVNAKGECIQEWFPGMLNEKAKVLGSVHQDRPCDCENA